MWPLDSVKELYWTWSESLNVEKARRKRRREESLKICTYKKMHLTQRPYNSLPFRVLPSFLKVIQKAIWFMDNNGLCGMLCWPAFLIPTDRVCVCVCVWKCVFVLFARSLSSRFTQWQSLATTLKTIWLRRQEITIIRTVRSKGSIKKYIFFKQSLQILNPLYDLNKGMEINAYTCNLEEL